MSGYQYEGVNGDKSCVFCDIRDGSTPGAIVGEGPEWLAFLDRRPLFLGHVLLIPREHVVTIMDLPDESLEPLMRATRQVSRAVQTALGSDGIFVASNNGVSQSVAHLHIHVVPRNKKDGLRGFMWPRLKYESEEIMLNMAGQIRAALS